MRICPPPLIVNTTLLKSYTAEDFHACHRLTNRERVIVKMTYRKNLRAVIKSRPNLTKSSVHKKLKIGRVYLVESLAGPYKVLLYQCQQMKAAGKLNDCWFFNGNINIQLVEDGTKQHVAHTVDLLNALSITEDELHAIVKNKR